MRVLDLFSGIGGFSLGLERAGMRTVQFCEIDPYCRAVLAKRWPGVPCHEDICTLEPPTADVICGGFPCQDISHAGDGAGLTGARSGLWREYHRIIKEVQPTWAIIENVSALRSRGLDQVLGQLAEIGYDAEWYCIPAAAVGAPHRRDRVWIIAYAQRELLWKQPGRSSGEDGTDQTFAAIYGTPWSLAHSNEPRLERWISSELQECTSQLAARQSGTFSHADDQGEHALAINAEIGRTQKLGAADWWSAEPDVGRVADGVPSRVDRLRALGNAVVPQIPEIIGKAIMKATVIGAST